MGFNLAECASPTCSKPVKARGYCSTHVQRMYRTGSAETVRKNVIVGTTDERIDQRLKREGDCLVYTGDRTKDGYGRVGVGGKILYVHMLMAERHHGPRPSPRHEVLHSCDNPPCCEPTHIRWGTRRENVDDMHRRGRTRTRPVVGEKHHSSRMTGPQVLECRGRRSNGETLSALAREFGVSVQAMSDLCTGRTWGHI